MRIISGFVLSILILFFGLGTTKAQSIFVDANKVDSLQKVEQRPMIVFIHTNWCKYCQMMAKSSFTWILWFEWCQPFRLDDASYFGSNDAILV